MILYSAYEREAVEAIHIVNVWLLFLRCLWLPVVKHILLYNCLRLPKLFQRFDNYSTVVSNAIAADHLVPS